MEQDQDPVTRREATEFQHKAVHAMLDRGIPRAEMATVLGLSLRSVRRYLNTPCPAWQTEKEEARQRHGEMLSKRPERLLTPFVIPGDDELSEKALLAKSMRETIAERVSEGHSKAHIARLLGISRQLVNHHFQRWPTSMN